METTIMSASGNNRPKCFVDVEGWRWRLCTGEKFINIMIYT